jgi:S1-C subfamily serine protease
MLGVYLAGEAFRAFGPASEAGIQNGDVIVAVDGYDVQGNNRYLFAPLTAVPSGRAVSFTLGDGRTVSVTAR